MCTLMVGIFFADDWQQRRFATLRYGYYSMRQHPYKEAIGMLAIVWKNAWFFRRNISRSEGVDCNIALQNELAKMRGGYEMN